jgi:uncharacterized protein (UPF0332 family)
MNHEERQKVMVYRWQKSQSAIKEAQTLAQSCFFDAAVSRLYYAVFYAASVLLLKNGKEAYTHKGVKSLLNQHFVKTNLISVEEGYLYAQLFDKRQKTDYADFVQYTEQEVLPLIEQTQKFLDTLEKLIAS